MWGKKPMRAPILLIALGALAAASIALGQKSEQDLNASIEDLDAASNAVEAAAAAVEAAADAAETTATGNSVAPAPARPAWLSGRTFLWAAESADGAVWYFEGLDSDFTVTPHRVLLRTDETAVAGRSYNNSERLAEIDCAERRYRILRTTHYDDSGRSTEADERGDGRLAPIVPDSVFAGVADTVCSHAAGQIEANVNGV